MALKLSLQSGPGKIEFLLNGFKLFPWTTPIEAKVINEGDLSLPFQDEIINTFLPNPHGKCPCPILELN